MILFLGSLISSLLIILVFESKKPLFFIASLKTFVVDVVKIIITKNNAIRICLQQAGRAIILTTLAVVGGLSVLFISGFLPIVFLGVLISVTLIGATIGAVVLLPSLLHQKGEKLSYGPLHK